MFLAGQTIVNCDEVAPDMYFISAGSVVMLTYTGEPISVLEKGGMHT